MEKSKTKKKYKKKNNFKINLVFNEDGETLATTLEKLFGSYCIKRMK